MNKIKRARRWVVGESKMIWMWVANIFFVFGTTKSKLRVFEGYGHYWLAQKYADRRAVITNGQRHYVLPSGDYSLFVVNRLELRYLKNKGVISKRFDYVKALESAYYVSKPIKK